LACTLFGLKQRFTSKNNLCAGPSDRLVTIDGVIVESMYEFAYLSSLHSGCVGSVANVRRGMGIAAGSMRSLNNIWLSRRIQTATKVRIYKSCIMAIFIYGSETWTLTKASSSSLQAFHMRCQRQLMCVRWDDFVTIRTT